MNINKEQDFSIPPRISKISLIPITYIKVFCYINNKIKALYDIHKLFTFILQHFCAFYNRRF